MTTIPGDKMVSIRLTADQWRWVYGVLDGQLDAGACDDGNYPAESAALHAATAKILRGVKSLRPTDHPEHKAVCDCQCPEPASGVAGISEDCPIHSPKFHVVTTVF
jgi:hypothetical protein